MCYVYWIKCPVTQWLQSDRRDPIPDPITDPITDPIRDLIPDITTLTTKTPPH